MAKTDEAKKSNDAIPSWSGFNYQGKMTLLCSMIFINALLQNGKSLDECFVELEKTEDFILFCGNRPDQIYQVKAKLADKKYYQYNAACAKLLEHQNMLKAQAAKCYLITAVQVDWESPKNRYKDKIKLYSYKGACVGVLQVPTFIKEQIAAYMDLCEQKDPYNVEYIYQALCTMLDEKVAYFHYVGKRCDYRISFNDICSCILTSARKNIENAVAIQKEQIYTYMALSIHKAFKDFCSANCSGQILENCEKPCGVKKHYEDLANLNLWDYIRVINPDRLEWRNLDYPAYSKSEDYKDLIFEIFSHRDGSQVFFDKSKSYLKNDGLINLPQEEIIPTLMSIARVENRQQSSFQSKLKSINENKTIYPFIEGKILSADTRGLTGFLIEGKVTHMPSEEQENKRKTTDISLETVVVDINTLITNMEEDNHAEAAVSNSQA